MLPEASGNKLGTNIISNYIPEHVRNTYTMPRPAYSLTYISNIILFKAIFGEIFKIFFFLKTLINRKDTAVLKIKI